MSKRQPARPKKKQLRPIVLPQAFPGAQAPADTILTGTQTKQIQDLIDLLRRNNLTELELERQGVRIRVRHEVGMKTVTTSVQEAAPASTQSGSQPTTSSGPTAEEAAGMFTITSPIVGTFYRSPSPDADPYVEDGDYVK